MTKTIKAWALQSRHGLIWKPNCFFYDPVRTALFKRRIDAQNFMKNSIGSIYGDIKAVRVDVKIELVGEESGKNRIPQS